MDFRDAAQRTRDDLARGAMADAALWLHSLQGRAGYLGAREMIQIDNPDDLAVVERVLSLSATCQASTF
ncbi:hypothetical protein [uncultured Thiocystis sp.]|jgi:hypothetical protein|uniref:hypothetical protein n=1 Tax=uncultured Thiocystis sp. TaxID=1202134 RepID=UPI0025CCACE6|nr:hypothetical protein [uncultured Thiocystis sp.]